MNPRLICFDLDGTLYQDSCVYLRMIDHFFHDTPYACWIEEIKEQMQKVLNGQALLKCGQFVPKQICEHPQTALDLFDVPAKTALLLPDPSPYLNRRAYSYLSDGWTLGMYLARRIGWEGDAFWQRFRQVRADLVHPVYGPAPNLALRDVLCCLRQQGIYIVLCSNAQAANCEELLQYLNLPFNPAENPETSCFDEVCFDADKPHTFPERISQWSEKLHILPEEMLFVGDQGYFDLYAGKKAGASTLLVSPLSITDAVLWDNRVKTCDEMILHLRSYCSEAIL